MRSLAGLSLCKESAGVFINVYAPTYSIFTVYTVFQKNASVSLSVEFYSNSRKFHLAIFCC